MIRPLPPLPGIDSATAPTPDDPGYSDWVERVGFSPAGVDRGLIWDHLHRSPEERLLVLEQHTAALLSRGGRRPEIL